jgi:hypothetical protein
MTSSRPACAGAAAAPVAAATRTTAAQREPIITMVRSRALRSRSFRFAALLVAVVLGALGLSACGGGEPSAQELLKQTFSGDHDVSSGDLSLALVLDAKGLKGLQGPLSLKLNGPFASQGERELPKFDLSLAVDAGGQAFNAGAVSTGDKGYLKLQGTNFALTDQLFEQFKKGYEQAAQQSKDKGGPTFASLGIDPLKWLTDPKKAGTEEVGGAETYHITAGIDTGRFLQDVSSLLSKAGALGSQANLPSSLTPAQRRDIERSVKDARLQVWTGKDDKALRRLAIDVDLDVPADVRKRAGGLSTGTLSFDLTIAQLNEDQTITAPKNARPLSDLTSILQGQAPSSGGAGTGTGGGAPSAGAGASSKYLECLQKAGSDVAAIQQCAALAGQ